MNNYNDDTNDEKRFFLDTVSKFCDKCGTLYVTSDVNIIQNTGTVVIIHFSCHNCKSENMVNYMRPLGVSRKAPFKTDLSSSEIRKFVKTGSISPSEILDVYTELKKKSKVAV